LSIDQATLYVTHVGNGFFLTIHQDQDQLPKLNQAGHYDHINLVRLTNYLETLNGNYQLRLRKMPI